MNVSHHSQTLEKRSSFVAKPPAGLVVTLELLWLTAADGGALAHPPKSSSAETVAGGLLLAIVVEVAGGFPQPDPRSFAVMVSGALIMLEGALVAGAGSGVLQASLPHGSRLVENILAELDVLVGGGLDTGSCFGAERLNTEFKFDGGGEVVAGGDGEVVAGADMSNRSLEAYEGAAGFADCDGFAA